MLHKIVGKTALQTQLLEFSIANSFAVNGCDLAKSAAAADPASQLREEVAPGETAARHDKRQHAHDRQGRKDNLLMFTESVKWIESH